jgi:excisionase family DNA binding protein
VIDEAQERAQSRRRAAPRALTPASISFSLSHDDLDYIVDALAARILAAGAPKASKPRQESGRMTVVAAAKKLGCSTRHVRRLVATGRLRSSKLTQGGSSRLFILREDVVRLLAEAEGSL